jgi:LacI family transcriptional regulator
MSRPRRVAVMLDLKWPYKRHADVFAGMQRHCQERGWELIIDEYADDTIPVRPAKTVPYDGVIARATRKLAGRAARSKVPVVNVWFSSPARKSLPGVFADFAAAGRLRAEHLLARGFRRFAVLTSDDDRGQPVEMKAFADAVAVTGFPCVAQKVPLDPSDSLKQWRHTERTIAAWMEDWRPPVGVYAGSEMHGRMVAELCRNRGWRVPGDVAIIAGWNQATLCEHPRPTLTSVDLGYERIGYEAARLLDRLMDEKEKGTGVFAKRLSGRSEKRSPSLVPEHILLPPKGLIVRESTDFFAVDDELIGAAMEFIATNSHLKIVPSDVAHAVNIGLRTLQRRFRKYLDRPIATEIRRVRIERAKRELTQSDRSIAQVSRDVGFDSPTRMHEVFCRELGVTPTEYRRQRLTQTGV